MMRKCHLNTCPVGIATQDPVLRKKFTGQAEHVINYFFFVAEQLREVMAKLGFYKVDEMIGQMDRLKMSDAINHWRSRGLDYSRMLSMPKAGSKVAIHQCENQDHGLDNVLDREMLVRAKAALDSGERIQIQTRISNVDRAFGAMLSGVLVKKYGSGGLPDDTISIRATGTAGQSFGAWLAKGIRIELEGEANDYVGKGLSGGKLIIYAPSDTGMEDQRDNIIVGNTVLYGAINGEAYFNGVAGERFCVRNSGVIAVVEGVGDHGCEYMTGGVVVCLGPTGKNFAAGMSGGIAYVLDEDARFALRCNQQMVTLETVDKDEKEERIDNLLEADEARLKQLITTHLECTGSDIARQILGDWPKYQNKFIKIVPHEFQQALLRIDETAEHEPEYMEAQHG